MTLRRALISTAIAGGSLLIATAPAFAGTPTGDDDLPETGANDSTQKTMLVIGGASLATGATMIVVRRRGARA